ncbi:hypothetical protein ER17_11975 [Mycobacterium tuberculosis]|nr:hypothetical protein ER17_11975 [Mycobacterium tuberculosis]
MRIRRCRRRRQRLLQRRRGPTGGWRLYGRCGLGSGAIGCRRWGRGRCGGRGHTRPLRGPRRRRLVAGGQPDRHGGTHQQHRHRRAGDDHGRQAIPRDWRGLGLGLRMGIVVEAQRRAGRCVARGRPDVGVLVGLRPGQSGLQDRRRRIGRRRRRRRGDRGQHRCAGVAGSACRPQRAAESGRQLRTRRPDHRHAETSGQRRGDCRDICTTTHRNDRYQLGRANSAAGQGLFQGPAHAVQRVTDCVLELVAGQPDIPAQRVGQRGHRA